MGFTEIIRGFKGYKSGIYKIFAFVSLFLMMQSFALAEEPQSENKEVSGQHGEHPGEKKFEPGKLVMDHIADSHEWHLWGSHEHPVSIPLPVIIYNKERGLEIFSSSRFEHGHASYNGYRIEEGKIVSQDESAFYDFSITKNVLAIFVAAAIILMVFISVARTYTRNKDKAPTGLQNAIEPVIMFVRDDIAKAAIGEKHYARFMPYLLTIFFFIWINNLLGLIPIFPGGANVTGNIA